VLSDITQVKPNSCDSLTPNSSHQGPSDYVFEIHCGETVYYVGENPTSSADAYSGRGVVCSVRSGSGLEQAQSWETAIRQARLPLATKHSTTNEASSSAATSDGHQASSEHCSIVSISAHSQRGLSQVCN